MTFCCFDVKIGCNGTITQLVTVIFRVIGILKGNSLGASIKAHILRQKLMTGVIFIPYSMVLDLEVTGKYYNIHANKKQGK